MSDYDEVSLRNCVDQPHNVLLIAYVDNKPAGIALAMKLLKPYKGEDWLYIDEVDVKPEYRGHGIATALMERLKKIAKEWGASEMWVGTEPDNKAGNGLYQSLSPNKKEDFVGYTYIIN